VPKAIEIKIALCDGFVIRTFVLGVNPIFLGMTTLILKYDCPKNPD